MKAKNRRKKYPFCVLCGAPNPTTSDHVPPRNLFRRPWPSNLITVPSCGCNGKSSMDDEYLRLMLTSREDVRDGPIAIQQAEAAMRGLHRPESRGLLNLLLRIAEEVEVRTPAGLYLGRRGIYKPDLPRLYRVIGRIVRGLFYHERGYALGQDHALTSYLLPEAWDERHLATPHAIMANEIATLLWAQGPPRVLGRGEVRYWWGAPPEQPGATAWVLLFYRRIPFVTVTVPPLLAAQALPTAARQTDESEGTQPAA